MAILCILFLWMFFPLVAMPCISHPLYFTRYKAKLFLFISCRERRLGEDPNLLSAIKVPISSFLDSINRTNKFVFILYLIGLGEIVYLVTLCWVFGIQKIFLSSFNMSSYSRTLFIYVTMDLPVFSFLCPLAFLMFPVSYLPRSYPLSLCAPFHSATVLHISG